MLKKVGYILNAKQKRQLAVLGIMIFFGGILETLGVSGMIPVVTAILNPDTLMEMIGKYEILSDICVFLHVDAANPKSLAVGLILALMLIYVIKNLYILLLVYRQNTFITQTRNDMISRVMREFLNRPYEDYLGADIPTVFRITDSDIPQTFSLMLAMLQLASEIVVSGLIFMILILQSPSLTLFILVIFATMSLFIMKVLKPKMNDIGKKNQSIQSRIAR